jgi:hypothetical protein
MQNRDLIATAQKQTVLLVAQFCYMQNRDLTATENKQFCWWPSFATCITGISPQPKQTILLVAQFCYMQNRDLTATETNSSAGGPVLLHAKPGSHRNCTETNSHTH